MAGIDDPAAIQVFGEELQDQVVPADVAYPPAVVTGLDVDPADPESVRVAACKLAGVSENMALEEAARKCRLFWDLNQWLIRTPLSLEQLAQRVKGGVEARREASLGDIIEEVHAALIVGTALPDSAPNALRLRVHRFFRGG